MEIMLVIPLTISSANAELTKLPNMNERKGNASLSIGSNGSIWQVTPLGSYIIIPKPMTAPRAIKYPQNNWMPRTIFNFMIFSLRSCFELFEMFFEVKNLHFLPVIILKQGM